MHAVSSIPDFAVPVARHLHHTMVTININVTTAPKIKRGVIIVISNRLPVGERLKFHMCISTDLSKHTTKH